jgi:hypothetical protein
MTMHHRNDEHVAFFRGVQNGMGEHPGQSLADILLQDRPAIGSLSDALDGTFHASDEALAQPRLADFVGACRSSVLRERVRVKRVLHLRRRDLVRDKVTNITTSEMLALVLWRTIWPSFKSLRS